MSTETVKGPAAYFPAIEKRYGQPVAHWLSLIEGHIGEPHMKIVGWLKEAHSLGHGHANALVAYALAKNNSSKAE